MKMLAVGSAMMAAAMAIPAASAQTRDGPAIVGYGKTFPTDGAQTRPDAKLRYRVLFNITKAAASPDKLNPSLEKVARFVNLLAIDGVKPSPGDIVAIVHGPATPSILHLLTRTRNNARSTRPSLCTSTA